MSVQDGKKQLWRRIEQERGMEIVTSSFTSLDIGRVALQLAISQNRQEEQLLRR